MCVFQNVEIDFLCMCVRVIGISECVVGNPTARGLGIPYSLDQTPRLLFISSPEFVRRLFESGDYWRAAFINTSSCQRGNP